jgi:hypothetical protein
MTFNKFSHQRAWQAVCETTRVVRDGSLHEALPGWFSARGINVASTLFAAIRRCDDDLYMGTLVDSQGRVMEFLANLAGDTDQDLDDVTDQLGPQCPSHPHNDPSHRVTMALLIQQGLAPPVAL